MNQYITVGIADMKVTREPGVFVTYALGSCVGICLFDSLRKIGGLGHILLSKYPEGSHNELVLRYADTCIPLMVNAMEQLGCMRSQLVAKIAGGAKMFDVANDSAFGTIGERNVVAVKEALRKLGIRIVAEDTGLNYGRTVYFDASTGIMTVKSYTMGVKTF